jgi:hypothetical protein
MRNNRRFHSDFDRGFRRSRSLFNVFFVLIGLGVAATFAFVGYQFYEEFAAEKFSLRKDTYTCTASHLEANGTEVWTICDTYSRIK